MVASAQVPGNRPSATPGTEPLLYDTAPIGEAVGPISYTIPLDYNRRRLASYGLLEEAFLPGSTWAEPSLLCGQHSWVMRQRFSWGGSVHAKCDIALLKPVALGARIDVTCRLSGKYERRGGRYVVFTLETHDAAGDLVCQVDNAMLLNFREVIAARRAARGEATAPANMPAQANDDTQELRISFGPRTLGHDNILGFFAAEEAVYGVHPSLHNRADIARAAGLPDIIAPGRYSIGLMNCMFARLYGEAWLSRGSYSVTFLQNLLPGLRLQVQVQAKVADAGAAGKFDIASLDQTTNRPVLSGTASLKSG
ncbi:MAG TPA: MaoC family dehydratase [Acetobacteraceae bacterium]|nr:MaoC family dehydratase [Acetobacteraceae bacterium]